MANKVARRKRVVKLSIDEALLKEAKDAGTNLSELLEVSLDKLLRVDRGQRWREENRDATLSMNDNARKNGLWADKYRVW